MKYRDPIPVLQRLRVVSSETRDAFMEAAHASRSPGLTALFLRRAEHQESIADYLSQYLTPGSGSESVPTGQRSSTYTLPLPITRAAPNHDALLRACIRVLDVAIEEFAKAYTPSLSLAQRVSLERHHDQMHWSREELVSLRMTYKPPHTLTIGAPRAVVQMRGGEDIWFGTLDPPECRNG